MEPYPTSHCDWGMPFFSLLPKCAAYSDSGYCGAHKWLSEEQAMEKERVGSRFKRKAPIRTPFLLSNLLRHKKSYSLIPKSILRERKGVIGQHSLWRGFSSSTAQWTNSQPSIYSTYDSSTTLCSCGDSELLFKQPTFLWSEDLWTPVSLLFFFSKRVYN